MKVTKKHFRVLGISLSIFFIVAFAYTFFAIYKGVQTTCSIAIKEYKGDCVDSLIRLVESDKSTLRQKNSAIWALGQMADKKALPLLYDLDKSLPDQEKCSLDACLSKYEVQKAIKWCEKGNITSWMYKNLANLD